MHATPGRNLLACTMKRSYNVVYCGHFPHSSHSALKDHTIIEFFCFTPGFYHNETTEKSLTNSGMQSFQAQSCHTLTGFFCHRSSKTAIFFPYPYSVYLCQILIFLPQRPHGEALLGLQIAAPHWVDTFWSQFGYILTLKINTLLFNYQKLVIEYASSARETCCNQIWN